MTLKELQEMMDIVNEQYVLIKAEQKKGKKLTSFDLAIIEEIEGKQSNPPDIKKIWRYWASYFEYHDPIW